MNAKLRKLKKQIERAGGEVMIPDDMPDDQIRAHILGKFPDLAGGATIWLG